MVKQCGPFWSGETYTGHFDGFGSETFTLKNLCERSTLKRGPLDTVKNYRTRFFSYSNQSLCVFINIVLPKVLTIPVIVTYHNVDITSSYCYSPSLLFMDLFLWIEISNINAKIWIWRSLLWKGVIPSAMDFWTEIWSWEISHLQMCDWTFEIQNEIWI